MSRIQCSLALLVCALVLMSPGSSRSAEVVEFLVIAHPSAGVDTLTRQELAHFFLKKTTRWESGTEVLPVDLPEDSAVRVAFSEEILQRSLPAVRAWWQQRIFSGRGVPPVVMETTDQVVDFVRSTPGAVAYVDAGADVQGVAVLVVADP
ncbi:type 2 periplasmic-binding domain-containing protein [Pyxidicoccus xibeiensis]|uniref:hypothetical protein n=1 Tax=Pyxidicoccus xibeiensis TaxID=2906759 RepID=UPI0020A7A6F6|nr:hypothetical protein [Pyxidicoccus xibeiensis]MCP3141147.1 hypothetical protein [Pyxidicoccus xibeiensis]